MELLDYAKLCQQSYDSGPEFICIEDLCFGVFQIEGSTVVVFRGSTNLDNWLRDFSVWPSLTMDGYLAHDGFVKAFDKLWPEVLMRLPKDRSVIVTGHSLGGALAVLCAEQLKCRAVTFGCPRVYFRLKGMPTVFHTKIVCDDDPVPMLPHFLYNTPAMDTIILSDQDGEIINPRDHVIANYIKRLETTQ